MEELLNPSELDQFLTKHLRIPDWKLQFAIQKWELLKLISRRYGTHPKFSFQNVTMASLDFTKRAAPTKSDSKIKCFNGKGGMCIEHNYFFASILVSIGYDAYIVGASVSLLRDTPLCHPICVIRMDDDDHDHTDPKLFKDDNKNQKLLMVDHAMGAPFPFEPIPLDQLPYSYMVGGYLVEYRINEEGLCQRVHIKGDPLKGDFRDEENEIRNWTDLKPMMFEEFEKTMTIIFTHPTSFFLKNLYAFRYLESSDLNQDDFKAVIIVGTKVIKMTKNTIEENEYELYEDVFPIFEKYFPDLSIVELKKAVETFRTNNPEAKK